MQNHNWALDIITFKEDDVLAYYFSKRITPILKLENKRCEKITSVIPFLLPNSFSRWYGSFTILDYSLDLFMLYT